MDRHISCVLFEGVIPMHYNRVVNDYEHPHLFHTCSETKVADVASFVSAPKVIGM